MDGKFSRGKDDLYIIIIYNLYLFVRFLYHALIDIVKWTIASFWGQWLLGNYSQSFFRMLGVEVGSEVNISVLSSSHACFLDPSIGQYCLMLASKNKLKNAIGELNAANLCRWASLMNITSFRRCGLPVSVSTQFNWTYV